MKESFSKSSIVPINSMVSFGLFLFSNLNGINDELYTQLAENHPYSFELPDLCLDQLKGNKMNSYSFVMI